MKLIFPLAKLKQVQALRSLGVATPRAEAGGGKVPVLSATHGGGPAILSSSHVPSPGGVDALWVQSTRVLHRLFFKNLGIYIFFCMDITQHLRRVL